MRHLILNMLYYNLKCVATFTRDVQCSYVKSPLNTKLRLQSTAPIEMFSMHIGQPTTEDVQSNLIAFGKPKSTMSTMYEVVVLLQLSLFTYRTP